MNEYQGHPRECVCPAAHAVAPEPRDRLIEDGILCCMLAAMTKRRLHSSFQAARRSRVPPRSRIGERVRA